MSRDETAKMLAGLLPELKQMATPIDFADLMEREVLKKAGESYLLLKQQELPKHAWMQMVSMTRTKAGMKVRFKDTSRAAQKLLTKIGS